MADEKKRLIPEGMFPDVMETLARGECIGLCRPPKLGQAVLTVAMDVTGDEEDAILTADGPNHLILSAPQRLSTTAQDYGIEGNCQTCTLQMTTDGAVQILNRSGQNVRVHAERRCHGFPTIVIRS